MFKEHGKSEIDMNIYVFEFYDCRFGCSLFLLNFYIYIIVDKTLQEAYHDHPIPELPTEIIFSHILPRLPAEDLMMRCRWVCKSWPSLIRSPSFAAAFLNFRCRDTTHFLFKYNNRYFSSKIEQQGNARTSIPDSVQSCQREFS